MRKKMLPFLFLLWLPSVFCIGQVLAEAENKERFPIRKQILKSEHHGCPVDTDCSGQAEDDILSLKELVKNSEIIAVGEVVSEKIIGVVIGDRGVDYPLSSCTIKFSKVLKGDKEKSAVVIAMPPWHKIGVGLASWKGPIYTIGVKGVWFLTKNPYKVPAHAISTAQKKGIYYFANRRERYKKVEKNLINNILATIREQDLDIHKGIKNP